MCYAVGDLLLFFFQGDVVHWLFMHTHQLCCIRECISGHCHLGAVRSSPTSNFSGLVHTWEPADDKVNLLQVHSVQNPWASCRSPLPPSLQDKTWSILYHLFPGSPLCPGGAWKRGQCLPICNKVPNRGLHHSISAHCSGVLHHFICKPPPRGSLSLLFVVVPWRGSCIKLHVMGPSRGLFQPYIQEAWNYRFCFLMLRNQANSFSKKGSQVHIPNTSLWNRNGYCTHQWYFTG